MSAAMLSVAPYMGLNFVFYEFSHLQLGTLHQRLTEHPSRSSSSLSSLFAGTISFASGAFAGGLSKTLIYPLDTVKKRLQAEVLQNTLYDRHSLDYGHDKGRINTNTSKYINFRHCIKKIFREEGIRGFYKGYLPTLLKSVFSTSIAFGAFELTKKSLSTFSQEQ
jgi:solute carrier family 25 (mitochondrial thiamine pyrophosphate transporter), member 19